jgi:hypothetical protein
MTMMAAPTTIGLTTSGMYHGTLPSPAMTDCLSVESPFGS